MQEIGEPKNKEQAEGDSGSVEWDVGLQVRHFIHALTQMTR